MTRIVSLVPSSTETLLALGANVVACTRFCEQPDLTHVGGTKNPDIAAIVEIAPDLVVLDREENRLDDADALDEAGIPLFVSDVRSVDASVAVVAELARAAGVTAPGPPEPAALRAPRGTTMRRPRVFVPIWRRPWMTIGRETYGGSLLATIGCELVGPGSDRPYPQTDLDEIGHLGVDTVLVPSEPYDFTDAHLEEIRSAVPDAAVIRIDGRDLFWWGIRTPGAIERLARRLSQSS